jgi:hypothetical protein
LPFPSPLPQAAAVGPEQPVVLHGTLARSLP